MSIGGNRAPSDLRIIDDVLASPQFWGVCDDLPPRARLGRPRHYPDYMILFYAVLGSIFRTARRVEAVFDDPVTWDRICKGVQTRYPDDESKWLPPTPMQLHHYRYGIKTLADPAVLDRLLEAFTRTGVHLALEMGSLDPGGAGSLTFPDPLRDITIDGKVITALFGKHQLDPEPTSRSKVRRRKARSKPTRRDPDVALHREGGRAKVLGVKHEMIWGRTEYGRLLLGTRFVPPKGLGGELGVAMPVFRQIEEVNPGGVLCVVGDMAMRGAHMERLMTEFGWLGITRVPARQHRVRAHQRGGHWVPKESFIELKEVPRPDGSVEQVPIHARNGVPGVLDNDEEGDVVFEPLERVRIQKHGKPGAYRIYQQYRLPERYEHREITLRLNQTEADTKRRFKRAENLRPIPPGDRVFEDHFGPKRGDAESGNRQLEDTLYINRAHSVGHLRQQLDLIGFGIMINAIAYGRHRAREGIDRVA